VLTVSGEGSRGTEKREMMGTTPVERLCYECGWVGMKWVVIVVVEVYMNLNSGSKVVVVWLITLLIE